MAQKNGVAEFIGVFSPLDTCKTGKIGGIRKLIGGCSQLRHFKLLCCMNVQ